jgi:predicted cobalt transporter CbtA
MSMIRKLVLTSILSVMSAAAVLADDCVLQITRTACPGKEAESFSKCGGKQSCTEIKPAASAAQCSAKAKEACANSRLDITKYKKITATFGGTPVEGGKDFCVGHPDFPYADQADCKD